MLESREAFFLFYLIVSIPLTFNRVFGRIEEGALNRESMNYFALKLCLSLLDFPNHYQSLFFSVFRFLFIFFLLSLYAWRDFVASVVLLLQSLFLTSNVLNFRFFLSKYFHAFMAFIFPSRIIRFTLLLINYNFFPFILQKLFDYLYSVIGFSSLTLATNFFPFFPCLEVPCSSL